MKKLLALLLVLTLMLPALALGADAPLRSYSSDFSETLDGWYVRGGDASVSIKNGALEITGRTENSHSIARDLAFSAGKLYTISMQIMRAVDEPVDFNISVAHTKDGVESCEVIDTFTSDNRGWAVFKTEYTPGEYDSYTFYVETANNPTTDFSIRMIKIETTQLPYDSSLPSLHQLYADYFDVGVALNQSQSKDMHRMAFSAQQFNIMTHENELKPDAVIDVSASRKLAETDDTAVAIHFTSAKPMLDYCKANNIKVHGHVLVWHNQTPAAFFHEGYDTNKPYLSRDAMLARLDNYIRLVFEYTEANYPGVIVSWDVVNEAVADNSTELRESRWTTVIGKDFVNRAFEIARKYAPEGVLLYYNDYSTPYEPKLTGICNLLDSLIAEGNIDGYGFQCHYSTGTPHPIQVRNAFERIASKGLRLRVSELDVGIPNTTPVNLEAQAVRYTELFKIFMDYADQLEAVQVWGLTDERSWRTGENPLLFNSAVQAKPAYEALVKLAQPAE